MSLKSAYDSAMEVDEYFYNDVSLLGIAPQNNTGFDDIFNSSACYINTPLDLAELITDIHKEPLFSGLNFSSNPTDCSSDKIHPNTALSSFHQLPSICAAEANKSISDTNLHLDYDNRRHDRETPSPSGSSKSSGSLTSGIQSDVSDALPKGLWDHSIDDLNKFGQTEYQKPKKLPDTFLTNDTFLTDEQPTPKPLFLSSQDYKALMQKLQLNGNKASKRNANTMSKSRDIVIKKSSTKLLQSLKITQAHKEEKQHTNSYVEYKPELHKTLTIDEKIYKKQQRLIKNRQSASLSRKKKREYVVSLETRINKLEHEYDALKGENINIHDQLLMLANTCKCEAGNACALLLNTLKFEANEKKHLRIPPKAKSSNTRITTATVKKNVAVLFAMAFIVTLNTGRFQSYLNKPILKEDSSELLFVRKHLSISGRQLLWVDSEKEHKETRISNTFVPDEIRVPPPFFLDPGLRNHNLISNIRNSENVSKTDLSNRPPPLKYLTLPKCKDRCNSLKSTTNQSEYLRLAQNLHKWMNRNCNMSFTFKNGEDNPPGIKLSNTNFEEKQGKKKMFLELNDFTPIITEKQKKLDKKQNKTYNKREQINLISSIKRKDDTFYVFAFNKDQALLPALSQNSSARPKLSLILSLQNPEINGDFKLMQVDCEVFNTEEFEVKPHMISAKLRPNFVNLKSNTQQLKKVSSETHINTKIDQNSLQYAAPRVRNFYMVGPKNQSTASASNKNTEFIHFIQTTNNKDYTKSPNARA